MNYHKDFDNSLSVLIDSVKYILYNRHENIFDKLDFENDKIYLDPLIFSYLNQTDQKWLDCIIYGYENSPKESIRVFSNVLGVVYIPNIGYFKTNKCNQELMLCNRDGIYTFLHNNKEIPYEFESLLVLNSDFELIKYMHPLLSQYFDESKNDLDIEVVHNEFIPQLNESILILAECNPKHFELLKKSHIKIMLYKAAEPNSFAALGAHNMLFLNVSHCINPLFFIDHISHEGAHVTFNTLTHESKNHFFKCHCDTPFAEVTGIEKEHSTIYLRFHGLFTFCEITQTLISSLTNKRLTGAFLHEAKARFIFYLRLFNYSLNSFIDLDVFEKEGELWFNFFKEYYCSIENQFGYMRLDYDLSDQPYDFNSEIFEQKNLSKLSS